MGSPVIAAWIAHLVFWILVVWGRATETLSPRATLVVALLWIVPFFGLDYMPSVAGFFTPYVAIIDIVLVLAFFKGDVRLT